VPAAAEKPKRGRPRKIVSEPVAAEPEAVEARPRRTGGPSKATATKKSPALKLSAKKTPATKKASAAKTAGSRKKRT